MGTAGSHEPVVKGGGVGKGGSGLPGGLVRAVQPPDEVLRATGGGDAGADDVVNGVGG